MTLAVVHTGDDGGLDLGVMVKVLKVRSWIYCEVGQTGFPNWLNVEWERKRRVKDDFKVSGPSN